MPLLSTKRFILYTSWPNNTLLYAEMLERNSSETGLQNCRKRKGTNSIEQNRKLQYNQEDKARGWLDRVTGHFAPVSSPPIF